MSKQNSDGKFMQAAIAEAKKGLGATAPNPAVGAVIVKNGRVVARGYHAFVGGPHAEIAALAALKRPADALGATLYVTLEPCSTPGRTGACTDTIIRAGFARVVYGATDPNPCHAGRARGIMRSAGIRVKTAVSARECAALNTAWNKWVATGLPYVTLKVAMSKDGYITAPPPRHWITSPAARRDAMRLRAACDAVLVGGETIRADNPRLTVRGIRVKKQPLRVVWCRSRPLPRDARIFDGSGSSGSSGGDVDGGCVGANADCPLGRSPSINSAGLRPNEQSGMSGVRVFRGVSLEKALRSLAREGVMHVLIEGGTRTHEEAFRHGHCDRVVVYRSPDVFNDKSLVRAAEGFFKKFHAETRRHERIAGRDRVPTLSSSPNHTRHPA